LIGHVSVSTVVTCFSDVDQLVSLMCFGSDRPRCLLIAWYMSTTHRQSSQRDHPIYILSAISLTHLSKVSVVQTKVQVLSQLCMSVPKRSTQVLYCN